MHRIVHIRLRRVTEMRSWSINGGCYISSPLPLSIMPGAALTHENLLSLSLSPHLHKMYLSSFASFTHPPWRGR